MRQSFLGWRSQCATRRILGCNLAILAALVVFSATARAQFDITATRLNPAIPAPGGADATGLRGDWSTKMYTGLQYAQGRPNDMFLSRADGKIYRVDTTTNTQSLFFQMPASDFQAGGGGYYGVLGFTFAPDFATSGKLYVHTADDVGVAGIRGTAWGTTNTTADAHRIYIREYTLNNPLSASPTMASQREIIHWDNPLNDHSGGWLGFQPDNPNILWILGGDGGNSDGSGGADNNPTEGAAILAGSTHIRSAQDKSDLLGSILRVDVSGDDYPGNTPTGLAYNYKVPTDNPFYNPGGPDADPQYAADGLNDAIWTYGNRSPWGAGFDRQTGDFIWGEVGQTQHEEVNFQRKPDSGGYAAVGGRNYGWRVMEGVACIDRAEYAGNECNSPGSPPLNGFTAPIHDYIHSGGYGTGGALPFRGHAVTGGYIYRGPIAALNGYYIFGDSSSHQIWAMQIDRNANGGLGGEVAGSIINLSTLLNLSTGVSDPLLGVTAFSEDAAGNMYFSQLGGYLYKISATPGPTATWNVNNSGDWATDANWNSTFSPASPNANTRFVVFGNVITSAATVYTGSAVTVKSLSFNNANKYVVAGNTITLSADAGNSGIIVTLGSHEIQAPLMLGTNTDITMSAGTRLDVNNSVNLNGKTLSVSGVGAVYFNNNLDVANGTVNNTGKLGGTGRINGALNNNGGTVAPGASVGTLTVETTYAQDAAGTLSVEVAGTGAGQADKLVVGGAATLNGFVSVTLLNGFVPSIGDVFTLLTASSVTNNGIAMAGGSSPYYLLTGSGTSLLLAVGVQGDYNHDGTVNAADYTVWRNALGQPIAQGTGADGDGSGTVTQVDFDIWKAHYGQVFAGFPPGSGSSVPEPTGVVLAAVAVALGACGRMRRLG